MNKRQVVVIHGGDSSESYEKYIEKLKQREVSLEPWKDWKSGLAESLGDEYQVILPRMPNSFNARYEEWKIWFEKYLSLLDDGIILVGHSLGGVFLAKYLTSEKLPKRVLGTFLVAAPYDEAEGSWGFTLDTRPDGLAEQGGSIFLYQSKDDPLVPYEEVEKYDGALPGATLRSFDDKGHFNQEAFPEIVEDIRSLS